MAGVNGQIKWRNFKTAGKYRKQERALRTRKSTSYMQLEVKMFHFLSKIKCKLLM